MFTQLYEMTLNNFFDYKLTRLQLIHQEGFWGFGGEKKTVIILEI